MGKKRIVIDTNIFLSALGWGGKPEKIIDEVMHGKYELVSSIKQFEEIANVLNYPKFDFSDNQKQRFLLLITELATIIRTKKDLRIVDDVKDNMILEIANETKIDYIVTGDDDLLRLKEFKNTKIVTVSNFLNILQ